MRCLRRGGFLGLLVDQNQAEGGVFVDFFGQKASTLRAPAALQRRTGAPIVTGYTRRVGLLRYRIRIDPPIPAEPSDDAEADVLRVTQEVTRRIETYVRETPGQWLWLHRRWRTRPPEEGDGGPGGVADGGAGRRPGEAPVGASGRPLARATAGPAWDSAPSR